MIKNTIAKIKSNKLLSITKIIIYFVVFTFYMIASCYFESYINPYLDEYKYCVSDYTYVNSNEVKKEVLEDIKNIDRSEYVLYKVSIEEKYCVIELSPGAEKIGFPTINMRYAAFKNVDNLDFECAYVNKANEDLIGKTINLDKDYFVKEIIDINYPSIGNPDSNFDYSTMALVFVFNQNIEVDSSDYIVVKSPEIYNKYYSSENHEEIELASGSRLKNDWNNTFKYYRLLIELAKFSVFVFFVLSIVNLFYMADKKNIYYDKIKFFLGAKKSRVFYEEMIYELSFIILLIPLPIIIGIIFNAIVPLSLTVFVKYGLLGFAELIILAIYLIHKRIVKALKSDSMN